MPKVEPKYAAALAAALLAVGAGAYSAQARGGSDGTTPNGTTPGGHHGRGHGGPGGHGFDRGARLDDLAKALGVSTDKLQAALKAVRDDQKPDAGDREQARDAALKTLADALGSDAATIQKVLDAQRPAGGPGRPGGPNGTTPQGTTPPKPPEGTTPQGTTPPKGGPGGWGGPGRGHGPGGHGGPGGGHFGGPGLGGPDQAALVTALAKATGKSEADVKAALEKLRTAREDDAKTREAAFAKALASKLGLDADKVTKALESVRPVPPKGAVGAARATPAPSTP